eukprot:870772-Pyramimonas_sp.AAC.1
MSYKIPLVNSSGLRWAPPKPLLEVRVQLLRIFRLRAFSESGLRDFAGLASDVRVSPRRCFGFAPDPRRA